MRGDESIRHSKRPTRNWQRLESKQEEAGKNNSLLNFYALIYGDYNHLAAAIPKTAATNSYWETS